MPQILGLDEVGRGPWAGPLVVGAVILPDPHPDWAAELTDSKKLTPKKRERLAEIILKNAPATGLGWVWPEEIDENGLSNALKLAFFRATREARKSHIPHSEIIIDGPVNFLSGTPLEEYVTNLNKADLLVKEVSAASIIAKVARDHYMTEIAKKYPGYAFERNVGYGTAAHRSALETLGPTPIHRFSIKPLADYNAEDFRPPIIMNELDSFNSNFLATSDPDKSRKPQIPTKSDQTFPKAETKFRKNTTSLGSTAEDVVVRYLETVKNHEILARNFKTKMFEVDIVSKDDEKLYFTEVKYRKSKNSGAPISAIDAKKRQKMLLAAETIYSKSPEFKNLTPVLTAASVSGPDFHLDDWFELEFDDYS